MAVPAIAFLARMVIGWMGCGLLTKLRFVGPFIVALNPISWIFIFKPISMLFRWIVLALATLFWMFVPGVKKLTEGKKRFLKSVLAGYITTTVILLILSILLWGVAKRVVCRE